MPQLIYMDGLNYHNHFFPPKMNYMNFRHFNSRIETFISALKNSGFELVVFIDANRISEEAIKKYCSRQEAKIRKVKNPSLPFKEIIMGEFFKKHGITVNYSYSADNDDTLASYAERDGAWILSSDQDFFRYRNSTFNIYKGFSIKKNRLYLEESKLNSTRQISKRSLLLPPETKQINPNFLSLTLNNKFYRGSVVTPLTKDLGNPIIDARPLRAAFYHRVGISEPILELIPYWDAQDSTVKWTNDYVFPDPTFVDYLDKPIKAREVFLSKYLQQPPSVDNLAWSQHMFGVNCTISVICSHASNSSLISILLSLHTADNGHNSVKTENLQRVRSYRSKVKNNNFRINRDKEKNFKKGRSRNVKIDSVIKQ